jgi:hypothetical protein
MPTYPVFASYAQADRERHLERFIREFREELRSRMGPDSSGMVFFDRDEVQAGHPWSRTVIEAANNAQVLLCLMSPTYLGREWCGRELEIFVRRYKRLPAQAMQARFIFPIWWQIPPTARPLPSKLGS